MCGLAGCLNWHKRPNVEIVKKMTDTIAHRGPDASGIVNNGPVVLGHRRLSIIDIGESNDQPLFDVSKRYVIVYNGEIYNYRELRKKLELKGAKFKTHGDTEVILEAYKAWGVRCLTKFTGMFAFTLWDSVEQELFIARDRLGEKPLFYSITHEESFVFASEPGALALHPEVGHYTDSVALSHYLSLNYTIGDRTLYRNINRLPPAHFMLIKKNAKPVIRCYWNLSEYFLNKRENITEGEAIEELNYLLDASVKQRMLSDVPLGAFLSGGLDSASIVASMLAASDANTIKTFCVGFSQDSYSELKQARETANYLNVSHNEEQLAPNLENTYQSLIKAADEPIADSSFLPTYFLAKFARKSVKVALSGDGGDECFGGYETYTANLYHQRFNKVPNWMISSAYRAVDRNWPVSFSRVSFDYKLRHFLAGLTLSREQAHYSWRNIFMRSEKKELMQPCWSDALESEREDAYSVYEHYFNDVQECDFIDQAMYVDMKTWLPDDILVKVDRATMANSLESRAPFLDHRLVEFAASIPSNMKINKGTKKYLLKKSQASRLPKEIINRKKQGFNAPINYWINADLKTFMMDVLSSTNIYEWLRKEKVDALVREHSQKKRDNSLKLLGIMSFGLWLNQN